MELTKEIKFNKELIKSQSVEIHYSGCLFANGSQEIYIVFGFDKDWKDTTYQKMDRTENGFSTTINLLDYNEFNFCFKDSNDNWDNNNNSDYHLKIEEKQNSTSDLNTLLDDILNEAQMTVPSPLEESLLKIQKIQEKFDEIFADIEREDFEENIISAESLDLEETFPAEYISDTSLETELPKETIQKISEIKTFEPLKSEQPKESIQKVSNININEPLKSEITEEQPSLALTTTSKHKNIFDFENLSPWYVFKKRVRLAFYKLIYVLPAFLFGEEDDSEN